MSFPSLPVLRSVLCLCPPNLFLDHLEYPSDSPEHNLTAIRILYRSKRTRPAYPLVILLARSVALVPARRRAGYPFLSPIPYNHFPNLLAIHPLCVVSFHVVWCLRHRPSLLFWGG